MIPTPEQWADMNEMHNDLLAVIKKFADKGMPPSLIAWQFAEMEFAVRLAGANVEAQTP